MRKKKRREGDSSVSNSAHLLSGGQLGGENTQKW